MTNGPTSPQRVIRMDQGNAPGSQIGPGKGSLLKAFGTWGRSTLSPAPRVKERRSEPRHHVECLAWVGWKTWRNFRMADALVINISRGGAQVFLDSAPPAHQSIWLFLETPRDRKIVKAKLRDLQGTASGQFVANVEFSETCPFAFFEAAVCGLAPVNPKGRETRTVRPRGRAATYPSVVSEAVRQEP